MAVASPARARLRDALASPKMLAILALGAASGFPNQISESTLQAWLKSTGSTNTTIGLLTYVGLPYLLKFLWAPLLDRYPLPLLGRRRGWILATQLGMIVSVLLLAVQEPTSSLIPIAICALLIVTFSASQDVVIDAYRADVTLPHERGLAAASNNLGYRAASWLAPAFALIVADFYGWRAAFITLAVGIALLTVAPTRAPEPLYRDAPPRTLADSVILPLRALLGTPGALALIVLIMLFKVGDAFALRLFTPFLIDSGFSLTEIGLVTKTVLTSSAIAGAVLGGIWMVKLGLLRAMLFFGVLQTIANLGYWLLAIVGKDMPLMIAVTALDNVAGGMGQVASVALIMAMCQARFSAFQYALLSVFALLPRYALGGPAGVLADSAGWDGYFLVSFFMGLPGIALVWLMRDRIRGYDVVGQKA